MRALTITALCVLALPAAAWSQEQSDGFARNGAYLAVSGVPNFTLDGLTFDGATVYKQVDGEEFMILPRLKAKTSVRALVGFRTTRGAFEIGYEQTRHVGTFLDISGEATFHSLNFDERIFFLTRGHIQPYGLVGLSAPWLTVKDGSFLDPDVADGTFRGFGVNSELGVAVFVHPRVGITAGYRYRAMWFDKASGVSETNYKLRPRFRETAGSLALGASFTF
ncbi:MAG TPA: outer membrane beta-barrel protein [Vicinamibacterales bacterium]|nr:outer membrane beta-barrel protein [Vicinamibacterales bacterium]